MTHMTSMVDTCCCPVAAASKAATLRHRERAIEGHADDGAVSGAACCTVEWNVAVKPP